VDLGLKGKKVVISGSTAGMGFAIAAALAAEGAQVIVNGRTDARVTLPLRASGGVSRMPMSAGLPLTSHGPGCCGIPAASAGGGHSGEQPRNL